MLNDTLQYLSRQSSRMRVPLNWSPTLHVTAL